MASEVPQDAIVYTKAEESMFVGLILQRSHGSVEIKINFGGGDESDKNDDDTYDKTVDFSNEFQSSGTYSIEKAYCQQRSKRDAIFTDLTASDLQKGTLLAVIDTGLQWLYCKHAMNVGITKIVFILICISNTQTNLVSSG